VAVIGKTPITNPVGNTTRTVGCKCCRRVWIRLSNGSAGKCIVNQVGIDSGYVFRIAQELNFVEDVKEIHTELDVDAFSNFEVLIDGEIRVCDPRSSTLANPGIAEGG